YNGQRVNAALLEDLEKIDVPAAARAIRCPVLILHGDADLVVPPEDARELHGCLAGARRLSMLPGGDHRLSDPALMRRAILGLVIGLAAGCSRDLNTAQGVAEEFVDQHYVAIDLPKARALTVSLAQHKLDEEIRLTTGQKIDAATQKPRVHYRLVEKTEGPERSTYLYEGTIESEDNTSFTRHWLITARKEANGWRVSNFTESD